MTLTSVAGMVLALIVGHMEDEYEFVSDISRYAAVLHGELYSIGKLDAKGNFLADRQWIDLDVHRPTSAGFPPCKMINSPKGRAYEYRSGRLIVGELDDKGNFLPDVGSKVISFKDYRYNAKAIRIYNLPGSFKKKGELKKD